MEHKVILGAEQYLPFARRRIKAWREAELNYAHRIYLMPGGERVEVWITDTEDYIHLTGAGYLWVLITISTTDATAYNADNTQPKTIQTRSKLFRLANLNAASGKLVYAGTTQASEQVGATVYGPMVFAFDTLPLWGVSPGFRDVPTFYTAITTKRVSDAQTASAPAITGFVPSEAKALLWTTENTFRQEVLHNAILVPNPGTGIPVLTGYTEITVNSDKTITRFMGGINSETFAHARQFIYSKEDTGSGFVGDQVFNVWSGKLGRATFDVRNTWGPDTGVRDRKIVPVSLNVNPLPDDGWIAPVSVFDSGRWIAPAESEDAYTRRQIGHLRQAPKWFAASDSVLDQDSIFNRRAVQDSRRVIAHAGAIPLGPNKYLDRGGGAHSGESWFFELRDRDLDEVQVLDLRELPQVADDALFLTAVGKTYSSGWVLNTADNSVLVTDAISADITRTMYIQIQPDPTGSFDPSAAQP